MGKTTKDTETSVESPGAIVEETSATANPDQEPGDIPGTSATEPLPNNVDATKPADQGYHEGEDPLTAPRTVAEQPAAKVGEEAAVTEETVRNEAHEYQDALREGNVHALGSVAPAEKG